MRGAMPVSRCTSDASSTFCSSVVAAAAWRNLPKRVPVFAYPQLGVSISNARSSFITVFTLTPRSVSFFSQVDMVSSVLEGTSSRQFDHLRVSILPRTRRVGFVFDRRKRSHRPTLFHDLAEFHGDLLAVVYPRSLSSKSGSLR